MHSIKLPYQYSPKFNPTDEDPIFIFPLNKYSKLVSYPLLSHYIEDRISIYYFSDGILNNFYRLFLLLFYISKLIKMKNYNCQRVGVHSTPLSRRLKLKLKIKIQSAIRTAIRSQPKTLDKVVG